MAPKGHGVAPFDLHDRVRALDARIFYGGDREQARTAEE